MARFFKNMVLEEQTPRRLTGLRRAVDAVFLTAAVQGGVVRVPGRGILERAAISPAVLAALIMVLQATRTQVGTRVMDALIPVAAAQEPPKIAADAGSKPDDAKNTAPGKKEGTEEEGVPKFPPVLSWKVKVKLRKDEGIINLKHTENGKGTEVEFEGVPKEKGVFTIEKRLPVDTSEKEKWALCMMVSEALSKFFKAEKPDIEKGAKALRSGKIPMTAEPKTIDWEVLAEQNDCFTPGHVRRARFLSDGESTIVIFSDKGGGDVVRVKVKFPADVSPDDEKQYLLLNRVLFGARALLFSDGQDTFERRLISERGSDADKPKFAPQYRIVRHSSKEVSTASPEIKKP